MRRFCRAIALFACIVAGVPGARAEGFSALAQLDPVASGVTERADGTVAVDLLLSQPVAWRVFTLDAPRRLVLDLAEVDWPGAGLTLPGLGGALVAVRAGRPMPGWSRLIFDLATPMAVQTASLSTDAVAPARLSLSLRPVSEAEFAALSGPPPALAADAAPVTLIPAPTGPHSVVPLTVVLDPGHGGEDAGAERDGVREADLMLTFARELREVLVRAGLRVVLTREADIFVPLDARVAQAQAAEGDLFVSLHADALAQGRATGATVYTLSESGAIEAARALSARRDRDGLMAGVDLTGTDDPVAGVLMDLARTETGPRSEALADALVAAMQGTVVGLHRRPRNEAGFTVLSAPDMPSVLVELGFLSNPRDRARLIDPAWRAEAAQAIRTAILTWAEADAATAPLRRR
ncbi:MAG: N-acetylmuramoyl-L-alanine amidase [Rhodobacteraceae bacterium]|nr:N-acetylmuramoyl-L-alanine amidase [Paracoccaceae bacterium]